MKKLFTLVLVAFLGLSVTSAMIGCSGSTPAKKEPTADKKDPDKKTEPTTDKK